MRMKLLLSFLVVLVLTAAVAVFLYFRWRTPPDFAKVGGTEIVFEIESPPQQVPFEQLCYALRQRLDPSGIAGVRVASQGDTEVVVRIPRGPLHDELIELAPNLASMQGRIEFVIVANDTDDRPAIDAATAILKASKDDLAKREKNNQPPPPPRDADGNTTFAVALADTPGRAYRWAEMGRQYLQTHNLHGAALAEERNAELRFRVEQASKTGEPFYLNRAGLCYVRPITDWQKRSKADRAAGKNREFFLLLREPVSGQEITGDGFERVSAGKDSREMASIDFVFNSDMGKRFYDMTSLNKPTGSDEAGFARQLAIVFDGVVMSAPTLRSPIRRHGQITGHFTPEEVDEMVRVLRSGALPVRLKSRPVSIRPIEPNN